MSEEFTIEHGVPIPQNWQRWPLRDMEVGDSFLFPTVDRHKVGALMSILKRDTGKHFIQRKVNDTQSRVWRVKWYGCSGVSENTASTI